MFGEKGRDEGRIWGERVAGIVFCLLVAAAFKRFWWKGFMMLDRERRVQTRRLYVSSETPTTCGSDIAFANKYYQVLAS